MKTILLPILAVLLASLAIAAPPPPTPTCEVTGTIESVTFQKAWKWRCDSFGRTCPTDTITSQPKEYDLRILVNETYYLSGEDSYQTCEELFPVGNSSKITIYDLDYAKQLEIGDPFSLEEYRHMPRPVNDSKNLFGLWIAIGAAIFITIFIPMMKRKKRHS